MSIKAIAAELELSVSTVSRALNDYPDISPRTKRRVVKEAKRQGYQLKPTSGAQWLQAKRVITAIVSGQDGTFLDPTLSRVLAGVRKALQAHDYLLQVVVIDAGPTELSEFERLIKAGDQEGFLVLRTRTNDPKVKRLLKLNVPFVCYGRTEQAQHFAWLDLDNQRMGKLAVEALVQQGVSHTNIAVVTVAGRYFFAKERLNGVTNTLERLGAGLEPEQLLEVPFDEEQGYLSCAEFLLAQPNIKGLVCLTSTCAKAAALAAMRVYGASHDIKVVGCDTPIDELNTSMGVACIQQAPPLKVGEQLAEMMIKRIQGTPVKSLQCVLLPSVVTPHF